MKTVFELSCKQHTNVTKSNPSHFATLLNVFRWQHIVVFPFECHTARIQRGHHRQQTHKLNNGTNEIQFILNPQPQRYNTPTRRIFKLFIRTNSHWFIKFLRTSKRSKPAHTKKKSVRGDEKQHTNQIHQQRQLTQPPSPCVQIGVDS